MAHRASCRGSVGAVPRGRRQLALASADERPWRLGTDHRHNADVGAARLAHPAGRATQVAALPSDLVSTEVDEPVHVEEWNPAWHAAAEVLAAECRAVLGAEALGVEHIGSTAVRGLAAKPVIDILIGVPAGRRIAVARRLASQGWTHLGEAGVPGREYLRRREGQHANVSVVDYGSTLWQDNLLLRDYLRRDADARRRYSAAKRRAAQEAPTLLAYSQHKAAVVAQLLDEAKEG